MGILEFIWARIWAQPSFALHRFRLLVLTYQRLPPDTLSKDCEGQNEMTFGKLPADFTGEKILTDLNLTEGENFVFACQATEKFHSGKKGSIGVFAFTDRAIYWLDTNGVHKKFAKEEIQGQIASRAGKLFIVTGMNKWELTEIDKSDIKFLESSVLNAYPKMTPTVMRHGLELRLDSVVEGSDKYGRVVVTANFGFDKKISLFSNCYVYGDGFPLPQKLIAISGDANVTKKSGLGRGIGAVVTAPLTGMLVSSLDGSNMRGDVYLTIVTDVKTHTIHIDMKNQMKSANPVGEMQKLVTTGEALIKQNQIAPQVEASTQQSAPDLASQLSSLNDLFQSGVLSESEFNSAKAKILGA
jgi:hypothetical protein